MMITSKSRFDLSTNTIPYKNIKDLIIPVVEFLFCSDFTLVLHVSKKSSIGLYDFSIKIQICMKLQSWTCLSLRAWWQKDDDSIKTVRLKRGGARFQVNRRTRNKVFFFFFSGIRILIYGFRNEVSFVSTAHVSVLWERFGKWASDERLTTNGETSCSWVEGSFLPSPTVWDLPCWGTK